MKRLLFVLGVLFIVGCDDPLSSNCDQDTLCTDIFASVRASVKHSNGEDVELDSVQTSLPNGLVIHTQLEQHRSIHDNAWGIVTDGEMDYLEYEGTELTFKGYRNGEVLFAEPYTIGKDCCHIKVIEGNFQLVL